MNGKILIYGASGGLGSLIARRLHAHGVPLHLAGRDADRLAALADEVQASYTTGDLMENGTVEKTTEEAGSPLRGLVYCPGTINLKPFGRLNLDDFMHDFHVNAAGAALAVQFALPALKKSSETASVVLFSSVAAVQGFRMHASMGMAKAAVSGLTRSLAAELAPRVRVNAIAPSLTDTPLAAPLLQDAKAAEQIARLHPMRRLGRPEDIAELAVFLLSEKAGWMTGQVLGVDGGRSTLAGN